jgi:hypothetical protein
MVNVVTLLQGVEDERSDGVEPSAAFRVQVALLTAGEGGQADGDERSSGDQQQDDASQQSGESDEQNGGSESGQSESCVASFGGGDSSGRPL